MIFKATIQFLKDQVKQIDIKDRLEDWFQTAAKKEDFVLCSVFRIIRHFEEHVEAKPTPRRIKVTLGESIQSLMEDGNGRGYGEQPFPAPL